MAVVEKWKHLKVIDVHNHDACCGPAYQTYRSLFDSYYIDRIVLFGNISEPAAIASDEVAWQAHLANPERIIPFFSGFEMYDPQGLSRVLANLDKGYAGVGETVAASSSSPVASRLAWKAQHPMDGNLPQVYQICAERHVPILLHIDPLNGFPIVKLEEALRTYPHTTFILAHVNAYNTPDNVERLVEIHPNLYLDFFAGFTRYNPGSTATLSDWVPLIRRFPDRFMLSTDSGFDIGRKKALHAMYETLDLIDDEAVARKVARENVLQLIEGGGRASK